MEDFKGSRMRLGKVANNGGIGGSGVHGFIGTSVICKSEDTSLYCNFMKFMTVIMNIIVLCVILFVLYEIAWPLMKRMIKGRK